MDLYHKLKWGNRIFYTLMILNSIFLGIYNYNDIGINTLRFRTIKDSGYVMPLKTWIMDAVWDQVNSQF